MSCLILLVLLKRGSEKPGSFSNTSDAFKSRRKLNTLSKRSSRSLLTSNGNNNSTRSLGVVSTLSEAEGGPQTSKNANATNIADDTIKQSISALNATDSVGVFNNKLGLNASECAKLEEFKIQRSHTELSLRDTLSSVDITRRYLVAGITIIFLIVFAVDLGIYEWHMLNIQRIGIATERTYYAEKIAFSTRLLELRENNISLSNNLNLPNFTDTQQMLQGYAAKFENDHRLLYLGLWGLSPPTSSSLVSQVQ